MAIPAGIGSKWTQGRLEVQEGGREKEKESENETGDTVQPTME